MFRIITVYKFCTEFLSSISDLQATLITVMSASGKIWMKERPYPIFLLKSQCLKFGISSLCISAENERAANNTMIMVYWYCSSLFYALFCFGRSIVALASSFPAKLKKQHVELYISPLVQAISVPESTLSMETVSLIFNGKKEAPDLAGDFLFIIL